jgi:hypothetical protein
MGLFSVTIEIRARVLVSAESEEAAWEYLNSTKEWAGDGRLQHPSNDDLKPVAVERVTSLSQVPEDTTGDMTPWGADENDTFAAAFYGGLKEPVDTDDEEENERRWDEFMEQRRNLETRFDREKTAPRVGYWK